jgi:hypothetical protein
MDMRCSPTLGYCACLLGFVLTACASGDEADDNSNETVQAPNKPRNERAEQSTATPPPPFDATFTERPASTDPKKDPAPANTDQCIDTNDPGGAENVATKLPDTDDCDDDYKSFSGVMKGAVDVDFYKLLAVDKGPSLTNPFQFCAKDTDFKAETAGTELCVFARCKTSTVDAVKGCEKGTETTSEIGMKGCCAAAPGQAVPEWDCSGGFDDDSADFFMRVRQLNGDKCLPYTVKYRF